MDDGPGVMNTFPTQRSGFTAVRTPSTVSVISARFSVSALMKIPDPSLLTLASIDTDSFSGSSIDSTIPDAERSTISIPTAPHIL